MIILESRLSHFISETAVEVSLFSSLVPFFAPKKSTGNLLPNTNLSFQSLQKGQTKDFF